MYIRSHLLISVVVLLHSSASLSQESTGYIEGIVQTERGIILENVNVVIEGTPFATATDVSGRFLIEDVPFGTYKVVISRVGYQTAKHKVVVEKNQTRQLFFSLLEQPIELSPMVVEREMVIGGQHKVSEMPGSAHYIGQAELAKQTYNDIHRVLRNIPGINIQEEEGYGLRPNIGMRGTGVERSQKITLMEDGVLIAPAPYAAPAAYYFPTAGRMQGIEVRKGSSQIKYGPYTTGGALNLISTQIPGSFSGHVNLVAGEDSERRIHATLGDSYGNFSWLAETYQANADGFKELDGGGDTGFDKKDYMAKIRLNTDLEANVFQQLTFKVGQTDEVSNETYLGLTDADFKQNPYRRYAASQNDQMNSEHRQYQGQYFMKPADEVDITATFYRNEFKRNWYKLDKARASTDGKSVSIADILSDPNTYAAEYAIITGATSPNDNALEVKANNREYFAQGIQSIVGIQLEGSEISHELELGVRYHEDEMDRFQWVDKYKMDNGVMKLTEVGTPGTESNRVESAKAWALFVQYNLTWGNWMATPGVRYEDIQIRQRDFGKSDPDRTGKELNIQRNNVNVWIPGIGLNFKFNTRFSTFVGVHKGFAPPSSKEGAKVEKSMNYEIGLRYQDDVLNVQGVAFFNDYDNLLGSDLAAVGGQSEGDVFNGGEVDVKGVELSIENDFGSTGSNGYSIPANLVYTYTDAKFRSSFNSDFEPWGEVQAGFELPYLPHHLLAANLGLENNDWGINVGAKYVTKMRTRAGKGELVPTQSTDAHLVFDASAEYAFSSQGKVFVTVRNLTDQTYIVARRPAGVRPGLPRSFMTGIKVNF